MSRVLITGADGQLGRAFARGWPNEHEVLALGSASLDVTDDACVTGVLDEFRPDLVINCAAYNAVDQAQTDADRAYAVNAGAPALLASELAGRGAALIHFSTDYVFDGMQPHPYSESDRTQPLSIYGDSKQQGEVAVAAAGGASLVFRTSWLYSHEGENFFTAIMRQLNNRNELSVVADQVGAPTYVDDLAEGVRGYLLNRPPNAGRGTWVNRIGAVRGLYHLCAQGAVSRAEFALGILERVRGNVALAAGVRCQTVVPVASASIAAAARRPLNSRLNCEESRSMLGIELPGWQTGLDRCIAAYERQQSLCGAAA